MFAMITFHEYVPAAVSTTVDALTLPVNMSDLQKYFRLFLPPTNSITVAAPLDVIKTRIQNRPFDSPESGTTIVRRLLANEGPSAFFKGLVSTKALH